MTILLTGGAGYIGTHICVELQNTGYDVLIMDNFCNSSALALNRVERITGKSAPCITADIRDADALRQIFEQHDIEAVIHLAGLKAVAESVRDPLLYYDNNVMGTLNLLRGMQKADVKSIVFSSSATVYGIPQFLPYTEAHPLAPINPYGQTKRMVEQMLRDLYVSNPSWKIANLRYFNPVGAHPSGLIGEDPSGIPNNLMPFICQVAAGKREYLNIWGGDYPSPDGSCIRDYIHVVDLAKGHIKALQALEGQGALLEVNLGTGKGHSVLEVVKAFEAVNDIFIPFQIASRRAGDIDCYYANADAAKEKLNWRAELDLEAMCKDSWNWQKNNPDGYK